VQETDTTSNENNADLTAARKKRGWNHYWIYGLAAGVYVLDQLVKFWAEQTLGPANSGKTIELLGGFFRFIYIKNSGASFGMLKDASWLFAILATVASIGIIAWYQWQGTEDNWYRLGVGLILGGVVGNLSDRLFKNGAVTDMLNFPNIELFRIFNVADTAITFGIISILLRTLVLAFHQQKAEKATR
jgi:signal peptidase II